MASSSMSRLEPLKPLQSDQAAAADPAIHAALSASAGTGKTQVLTARVLKLLLTGVAPETILCLTFTKAAAAEMANRIGARLASWVRLDDAALTAELRALGEMPEIEPELLDEARRLFARVLDAPGGLRIQTIHSFAQTLLAAFPAEAGITPGFRPIEGREEQALARRTLAALVADAESGGNWELIADIQALSRRLGEAEAVKYLMACARQADALSRFVDPIAVEPALRSRLGLPEGSIEELVASRCSDDSFDCALLSAVAGAHRDWGTKTGHSLADQVEAWLSLPPADRCRSLGDLASVVFTQKGERRKVAAGVLKIAPVTEQHCDELAEAIGELLLLLRKAELLEVQSAGLRAGMQFAEAYKRAKRAAGVADFDDLIRWTRELLLEPGMGDWVRYKLDQRTDHMLVDEAQDTNTDQWAIVDALTEEYFSGEGARSDHRTLFMVGDFKQAIYGFQGTDPSEFEKARARVREKVALMGDEAREFRDLSISASFRSAQPVLDVVDWVVDELGHEAIGLPEVPPRHRAFHHNRAGLVELWPPYVPPADDGEDEAGEEGWVGEPVRRYASHLAKRIKGLVEEGAQPGDVLVLVRSRGELASLIVARLFAEDVPVAGIDRLQLSTPLAVQDLMAAVTFAVQPLDDLNLASLLVSPLIGWDQQQLYELAFGRERRLWEELRRRAHEREDFTAAHRMLGELLRVADFTTPARFLELVLSGPMQGRRKLFGRLGEAARDPIDELVASAFDFERTEAPSLDRFLAWFSSGEVEVKRDPSAPTDAVRVMTVHGAKGLEAPVVILADATADPEKLGDRNGPLKWQVEGEAGHAPVIRPRKDELCEPWDEMIAEARAKDLQEHWRLLYVAMTRAADRLIIAGVKPSRGEVSANSWHATVQQAMAARGAEEVDGVLRHGSLPPPGLRSELQQPEERVTVPDFLRRAAPEEARPPRPLAPSQIAEDRDVMPPPSPELREAARRGTLLHALFERLPGVAINQRRELALRWLEVSAGVEQPSAREELADAALSVIGHPDFADLFASHALAEAPIAATLPDGRVVAGTVDRLLVEDDRVRVIDFKTGRFVPDNQAAVPEPHRRQMEAYAQALAVIFPDRRVETALLYTAGPRLIALTG